MKIWCHPSKGNWLWSHMVLTHYWIHPVSKQLKISEIMLFTKSSKYFSGILSHRKISFLSVFFFPKNSPLKMKLIPNHQFEYWSKHSCEGRWAYSPNRLVVEVTRFCSMIKITSLCTIRILKTGLNRTKSMPVSLILN